MKNQQPPLLRVKNLAVEYGGEPPVRAVDGVSLEVTAGQFLGIVGESGCGKSTLLFAIARLLSSSARVVDGTILLKGVNLLDLPESQLRESRWREFAVVMQSAMNALNPVLTIGAQLRDAIGAHKRLPHERAQERAAEMLNIVGINPIHLRSYPHQLSGGMRQRAMVAMALVLTPPLVMMDEPTSALDVVGQLALMRQIKELQHRFGFTVIFVSHDLALVSRFSDRLAIMYAGQIVELGDTRHVFQSPKHPYTQALLDAFPSIRERRHSRLLGISGNTPDLRSPPSGCRFHPRCPRAMGICPTVSPGEFSTEGVELVRCHLYAPHA